MKIAPRPSVIVRGRFRAVPMGNPSTTHWEIQTNQGRAVLTMTPEEFARDGERALDCYNDGKPFTPRVMHGGKLRTAEEIQELRIRSLEFGADATSEVSEWTRYVAAEECREGGELSAALEQYPTKAQWPAFVREMFADLFGVEYDAEAIPDDERPLGAEWIEGVRAKAQELEEWESLRKQADGDPWATGICASMAITRLADALEQKLDELPEQDPQELQDTADTIKALAGEESEAYVEAQEAADKALEQAQAVAASLMGPDTRRLVSVALVQAQKDAAQEIGEVDNAIQCVPGFGPGTAELETKQVDAPREEIRELLKNNPRIANMLRLAGRLRLEAKKKQRAKSRYVPEQTVGVTLGDELNRLLPAEAMLLACDETEALGFRRLLEKQMMQYDIQGSETETRGPVIMCVDSSGSMSGQRNEWAMAAALAMAQICHAQRRAFQLVHFSYTVNKVFTVPRGGSMTFEQMVDMIRYFNGGGTDFEEPLNYAIRELSKADWKKSDVVLVTDGEGYWQDAVEKLHELGASVFGLAVGASFSQAQRDELDDAVEVSNLADPRSEAAAANVLFTV